MNHCVLLVLAALLSGKAEGQECGCVSFWECISTGGSPLAYCDQSPVEVCCSHGENAQDNALNDEAIGSASQPDRTRISNGSLPAQPPPPVRLFGDKKVKPIINTAFRNAIPARPLGPSSVRNGNSPEDRSLLDAFPPNVVSPPDGIDPLTRSQQEPSTKQKLSSSPTPISARSLSFRARINAQLVTDSPRVLATLIPLTTARLPRAPDEASGSQQSQSAVPSPSSRVPLGPVHNTQSAFSFLESLSSKHGSSESQPNVPGKPQFSFRDTRLQ